MRLAFFHDTRLIRDTHGRMHSSGFAYSLWKRYLTSFEHIVISTRVQSGSPEGLSEASGPGVTFAPIEQRHGILGVPFMPRMVARQARTVLADVDCAVVRLPSVIGSIAYNEARRMGKPVMVELVGCPWDAYWNHGLLGKFVAPLAFAITRLQVSTARIVLYVTERFLQQRYPTKGSAIACSDVLLGPVHAGSLSLRRRRIELRQDNDPLILGTVAPVDVKYKGHDLVLKAIASLGMRPSQMQYWVIGGGDPSRLKAMVLELGLEDHVVFLGAQTHSTVLRTLEESIDLYVQPSLVEGLPRAVVEAMSVGCPVIGARVGGIPELLDERYLFKVGDAESLGKLLFRLTKCDFIDMAEQNFNRALVQFDPQTLDRRREGSLRALRASVLSDRSMREA